jgi:dTDP-4-amino-4,6-dideoxygalactose transaminase
MQDEELFWKITSLRLCGRDMKKGIKIHSGNYRMTGFQAAILLGQLEAFKINAEILNSNGLALDKVISEAPGVAPLYRNKNITRQCSYGFAFLYKKEYFDGIDTIDFHRTLFAEIGCSEYLLYESLANSTTYNPTSKKRHKLGKKYLEAINPSRWKLPVTEDLIRGKAVVIPWWRILNTPPEKAGLLADAITKIYENRKKLRDKLKKVKSINLH